MLRYYKSNPNDYVVLFEDGNKKKQGKGINFWYLSRLANIMVVPTTSRDTPFIFTEMTGDYQELAVQGTLSYRVKDPAALAEMLDMSIDFGTGTYKSDDPAKIINRVVMAVQDNARARIASFTLREALTGVGQMADEVLKGVKAEPDLVKMGISVEGLHFTSVRAKPEMQKALEADYREKLQREADQAIYARRAAAQGEEQKLKTAELDNSIKLKNSEMGSKVELEAQRTKLVDSQARNKLALAQADAKAEQLKLDPYTKMSPQTLMGLALKEWAGNAGTIDNLTITPDMLSGLLNKISTPSPTVGE